MAISNWRWVRFFRISENRAVKPNPTIGNPELIIQIVMVRPMMPGARRCGGSPAASAWANAWNTRTRGASTLTMQLAGLLQEDLARPAGGRGVAQKITQMARARQLESSWTKAQILEAYLNLVPFRSELVGIDALSRTLFGKAAHGLDEREAAVASARGMHP